MPATQSANIFAEFDRRRAAARVAIGRLCRRAKVAESTYYRRLKDGADERITLPVLRKLEAALSVLVAVEKGK